MFDPENQITKCHTSIGCASRKFKIFLKKGKNRKRFTSHVSSRNILHVIKIDVGYCFLK